MNTASKPWFKFYPRDWKSDDALRSVSMGARALWIEMLCVMHGSGGYLLIRGQRVNPPLMATLAGCDKGGVEAWIAELEEAQVFSRSDDGVIYSRRMVRDAEKSEESKEFGRLGGNPQLLKGRVNPPLKGSLKPRDQRPERREDTPLSPLGEVAPTSGAGGDDDDLELDSGEASQDARQPLPTRRRGAPKPTGDRSSQLEAALALLTPKARARTRPMKDVVRRWQDAAKAAGGEDVLLAAFRRYAAEDPDRERHGGAGLQVWCNGSYEPWLGPAPSAAATAARPAWEGPSELREYVAATKGDAWTGSYLDPAGWDDENRVIKARTAFAADKLRRDLYAELKAWNVVVEVEKAPGV